MKPDISLATKSGHFNLLPTVRDFAEYFHQPPDKLGPEQIRQYQAHLFQAKKLAPATVSQYVSALRFLFRKMQKLV